MKADPLPQHAWLQKLVGTWTMEADDGGEGSNAGGVWTETFRSLHGLWVVGEAHGELPGGGSGTSLVTLGYDPAQSCYVSTWIGSMMTHLWVCRGTVDETGRVLTLDTTGPDFANPERTLRYQDIIEVDGDTRTLTARVEGEDGAWTTMMTARYRRTHTEPVSA